MRTSCHRLLLTVVALALIGCDGFGSSDSEFEVAEASILELQQALEEGRVTSRQLVDRYLDRIAAYDGAGPELNTITRLNPRAREEADALDLERAAGTVRGPLHGIPVLMKDNYDVAGMPTTGSSLALSGLRPADDAFQVARLREAGAIVVGKTNLHELAAGITTISSLGGQSRNAYEPARNPGGSSGGTGAGVAASFAAVGWGSDTCGSIRIPAAVHNLFGLRPTKGLSSIDGILPLSHSQDTGGAAGPHRDRPGDRAGRDGRAGPGGPGHGRAGRPPDPGIPGRPRPRGAGGRPHRCTGRLAGGGRGRGAHHGGAARRPGRDGLPGRAGRRRDHPRPWTACSPTPASSTWSSSST